VEHLATYLVGAAEEAAGRTNYCQYCRNSTAASICVRIPGHEMLLLLLLLLLLLSCCYCRLSVT
jgi:hypothetical protein